MNNALIIAKKELIDFFKDKKSFYTTLVLGIFLFPFVMYLSLSNSMNNAVGDATKVNPVAVSQTNAFTDALQKSGQFDVQVFSSVEEAKKEGVALFISFPETLDVTKSGYIRLHFDFAETKLMQQSETITSIFNEVNESMVRDYLKQQNLSPSILSNISIESVSTTNETKEGAFSIYMLSLLLPMVLLLQSSQGINAIAVDLGAGEKERGTLEPLLTTNASTMSIIFGKFIVVATVGLLTAITSLVATLFAVQAAMPSDLPFKIGLNPSSYAILIVLMICLVCFNSMLALTLSILAKSTKEANTYLVPLTLIPVLVSFMVSFLSQGGVSPIAYAIPYVNVALMVVDLIKGQLQSIHLMIGFGSFTFFILAATMLTIRVFKNESIINRS